MRVSWRLATIEESRASGALEARSDSFFYLSFSRRRLFLRIFQDRSLEVRAPIALATFNETLRIVSERRLLFKGTRALKSKTKKIRKGELQVGWFFSTRGRVHDRQQHPFGARYGDVQQTERLFKLTLNFVAEELFAMIGQNSAFIGADIFYHALNFAKRRRTADNEGCSTDIAEDLPPSAQGERRYQIRALSAWIVISRTVDARRSLRFMRLRGLDELVECRTRHRRFISEAKSTSDQIFLPLV